MQLKIPAVSLMTAITLALSGALPVWALPLSPGDRLRIQTPADDELPAASPFRISGLYEINLDGTIQFPFVTPQQAAGLEPADVEKTLSEALVRKGYFKPDFLQLSVRVVQWAPIQVTVSGETFFPGRVLINARYQGADPSTLPKALEGPIAETGEYPTERYLTAAIRASGGFKPTADIRNVKLVRGDKETTIDLSGIFTGESVPDVPLIAGDRIIIPKATIAQSELARPSQLTPQEITIFLANQTQPSPRAGQMLKLEYGARFAQAVVFGGCAGGTNATNARRRVALVRTDRLTGQTQVVDRPVEALLRSSKTETDNPLLMPQDGVVCYDSTSTNVTGIFRLISDIFSPFFLIQRIFNQ
jgi:polysaccharide export outer membrane protein